MAAARSRRRRAGEIVAFSGISDITIGRTICVADEVQPLPFVKISDPTIEMTFSINDSPFAGREGKYVTSRNLRDRLQQRAAQGCLPACHRESAPTRFNVAGRGEMHLSILIETMRREGYEFQVSTPHVLTQDGRRQALRADRADGRRCAGKFRRCGHR